MTNSWSGTTRLVHATRSCVLLPLAMWSMDSSSEPRRLITDGRPTPLVAPRADTLAIAPIAQQSTLEDKPLAVIVTVTVNPGSTRLLLTASSSNGSLVPTTGLAFSGTGLTRTLTITPTPDLGGNTQVTVTADDGTAVTSTRFPVTVTPVNDPPTLNALSNLVAVRTANTVALSGITAGPRESQPMRITAISSDPQLVPNPVVTYTSPMSSGSIRFTPAPDRSGSVVITVTVEDGGLDSNLASAGDNMRVTRMFTVTVNP